MPAETLILVGTEADIVAARQTARQFATSVGFGSMDQSRITTAVSELARNIVRYATDSRGRVRIREANEVGRTGIEIVVEDDGPGIADLDEAMREGFTSGNGLGLGLSGTRRLMDDMDIRSEVGVGTVITIRKWRR